MGDKPLSYWDYVKAAFNQRVPLRGLGAMPMNKLFLAGFGILGFGHPGFWLLGLGLETAYLLYLSGSSRYQALIRGERLSEAQDAWKEREVQILDHLDVSARKRYHALVERCRSILNTQQGSLRDDGLVSIQSDALNQLLYVFLQLLNLRDRIQQTLRMTSAAEIDRDIKQLDAQLEKEKEDTPVYRSLTGRLAIQKARLQNILKSHNNLRYTESELDRIEKQISLTAEELAVSKDPEKWTAALDGVVQSVQGTTKWMADHSDLLDTLNAPPSTDVLQSPPRQTTSN